jgi:hypothetical protein
MDNFSLIEDLASAKDDKLQLRKKQAIDIINGLIKLCSDVVMDESNAQKVCRAYCALLNSRNPQLSPHNLNEALKSLSVIMDKCPQHEIEGVVQKVQQALSRFVPVVSTEFKPGSDGYNNFHISFKALMSSVGRCTTPAAYPLLKHYAFKESNHLFEDMITEALDAYVLNMAEASKEALADTIIKEVFDVEASASDWVSLETQRNNVRLLCLRLLHASEEPILVAFLKRYVCVIFLIQESVMYVCMYVCIYIYIKIVCFEKL